MRVHRVGEPLAPKKPMTPLTYPLIVKTRKGAVKNSKSGFWRHVADWLGFWWSVFHPYLFHEGAYSVAPLPRS